jgi:hypothetical protein
MRKRFEQQCALSKVAIAGIRINLKCRDTSQKIALALIQIFNNQEYNEWIFSLLETNIVKNHNTGRHVINFWQIFVMAQFTPNTLIK